MRTLSARILLGFAVLMIMIGVYTVTVVISMSAFEDQMILILRGYVPFAFKGKELVSRQEDLYEYLDKRFTDEPTAAHARGSLPRARNARNAVLRDMRSVIANVEQLIDVDPRQFTLSRPRLEALEASVAAVDSLYATIQATPPIATLRSPPPQLLAAFLLPPAKPDEKREAAAAALVQLLKREKELTNQVRDLAKVSENNVNTMTVRLQQNEQKVREGTTYVGIAAIALGLLVTVWVVITLRPLRRLRDGARRIAAGDYANRIPERGPVEVLELAREFNSMGRAIEERERELVRSERLAAIGKMAQLITHEVRNPLSSIALNTELLVDEIGDSDEARDLCRAIQREIDRLTAITEDYLGLAKLPKPKLAPEPVNQMVHALAAFVREDLSAKQVSLTTELDPGDPIAQIDAGQIRQCLINLIRNASDAVSANGGGAITLRTRVLAEAQRVELAVVDDGVGIPTDVLPRVFDSFFSTKKHGSGLGLPLTHQIVRDHGGDLQIESTVGRGTTFTLSLPLAAV